jgi:hypothetical protein
MDETVKLDTRRHRVFEPIYSDFFDTIPQSFSDVRVRVRVRGLLWSPSPKISDLENPSDSDSACLLVYAFIL